MDTTTLLVKTRGQELKFTTSNAHQFSRFSEFFKKLHTYKQTSFTLDFFDEDIVRRCIELLAYVADLIPGQFFVSCKLDYENEVKRKVQSYCAKNLIEVLKCLDYLQTNKNLMEYIVDTFDIDDHPHDHPNDPDTFDIDEFVQLNCIPLEYLWGYWSIYGKCDSRPPIEPSDTRFIPFCRSMTTYEDHVVVNFKVVQLEKDNFPSRKVGPYTQCTDYSPRVDNSSGIDWNQLRVSCEIFNPIWTHPCEKRNNRLAVTFTSKYEIDEYFMSVMILQTRLKGWPLLVGKFFYMISGGMKWNYDARPNQITYTKCMGAKVGQCFLDKVTDGSDDVRDYVVLIKPVNFADYKQEFKWYSNSFRQVPLRQ